MSDVYFGGGVAALRYSDRVDVMRVDAAAQWIYPQIQSFERSDIASFAYLPEESALFALSQGRVWRVDVDQSVFDGTATQFSVHRLCTGASADVSSTGGYELFAASSHVVCVGVNSFQYFRARDL